MACARIRLSFEPEGIIGRACQLGNVKLVVCVLGNSFAFASTWSENAGVVVVCDSMGPGPWSCVSLVCICDISNVMFRIGCSAA